MDWVWSTLVGYRVEVKRLTVELEIVGNEMSVVVQRGEGRVFRCGTG